MIINVRTIPHSEQRYDTVGDWQFKEPGLLISGSEMSDPRFTLNIQIHEIIEALLCRQAGIMQQQVDEWDLAYEVQRNRLAMGFEPIIILRCGCEITATSDPGDDPHAPYHEQHNTASTCEMIIGAHLKIDWARYLKEIEEL